MACALGRRGRIRHGWLRPADSRLHATRDRRQPASRSGAGGQPGHRHACRGGGWRHRLWHACGPPRPRPRPDLVHPALCRLHRPLRGGAELWRTGCVPNCRRAWLGRGVRHRHGLGRRSMAGSVAGARVILCRPGLAGGRAAGGIGHTMAAANDRLAGHVRGWRCAGARRVPDPPQPCRAGAVSQQSWRTPAWIILAPVGRRRTNDAHQSGHGHALLGAEFRLLRRDDLAAELSVGAVWLRPDANCGVDRGDDPWDGGGYLRFRRCGGSCGTAAGVPGLDAGRGHHGGGVFAPHRARARC